MEYAVMAAGSHRHGYYYRFGIYHRLYCKSLAGLECMGLQQCTIQRSWPDLPAVHLTLDTNIISRNCFGRLSEVLDF